MITQPRVMELLRLDLENGRIFWRDPPKNHRGLLGREAGCARPGHSGKSYWYVKLDGRPYKRSHLIFLCVFGRWPTPVCDHKDGDSLNDRPGNLRAATATQNAQNHKRRARRIRLPMGVRITGAGRYEARIGHNKGQLHLGAYDTPEQASAIYQAKRKELFGEYA